MHCPRCGQHQISDETRFCSRCGFLLTGIAHVIANDGIVPQQNSTFFAAGSPRRRGMMQGVFFFLLTFLVVPIIAISTAFLGMPPFFVAITAVLFFVGGLLRGVYALMVESGVPGGKTLEEKVLAGNFVISDKQKAGELPPAQSIPVNVYAPPPGAGHWRDTNDLAQNPGSVTDGTTKLLQKDEDR
ncbi:MAG: zinc ribbon domain-containing protein [Pyrinomonadaceae bacterium]